MIHIQLAPEIEAQLAAEAQARGLALERYIVEKLSESAATERTEKRPITEAVENIRALRKGNILGGIAMKDLIDGGRKY